MFPKQNAKKGAEINNFNTEKNNEQGGKEHMAYANWLCLPMY